jgi:hypothetical protein
MVRVLIFLIVSANLAACASVPVSSETAEAVPSDRIFDSGLTTPSANKAKVVVTRDRGFGGGGCTIKVFCDGTLVAGIRTEEKLVLYMSPGEHIIGAKHGGGICGGGVDQTDVNATLEKPRNLRIAIAQSGDIKIEPSAF